MPLALGRVNIILFYNRRILNIKGDAIMETLLLCVEFKLNKKKEIV